MTTELLDVLQPHSAARFLGIAESTLAKLRLAGNGPIFCKVGRRVVYRRADLESYLALCRRSSTSDAAPPTEAA